jgi:hypothetical protein
MASHVEHAALMRCQFGTNTAVLNVAGPIPIATVEDFVPLVNIQPFGACICPGNPGVAAATAAAGGALVPVPCVPAVEQPWLAAGAKIRVRGVSGLAPTSTAHCRWGGMIELVVPKANDNG